MMRNFAFGVFLALFGAGLSRGQEAPLAPAAEYTASYSYLRVGGPEAETANWGGGWNMSLAGNLNHWLGGVAEFSGHYGEQMLTSPNVGAARIESDSSVHTFLFGPRFTARWNDRVQPFAHALFGLARIRQNADQFTGGQRIQVDRTEHPFALAVGGGLNFPIGPLASFRAIQADYLLTRPGGTNINNLRISSGFVFRFGSR